MSARANPTLLLSARAVDPLASLRAPAAAIADLAFGSLTADASVFGDGHLAILPADALELDLSDPAQREFGDYELRELIGRGGMGVVYRAYQKSLDREVAVKLLAAGPWASREFVERFRHEAQNAARMQHPNIVAIYEVGAAEEMHFFSMRMVHGGSLAALLKCEGRLQPQRAAQLLRGIAEAVDYAHRLGVLHLDLKPANVLLDETGAPHVADFGLARRLDHDLTTTSTEVSGTPSYMAPEQTTAGPQKITPATDIWGLGAILYELVTGEPPFLGESPQDTLRLVAQGTLRSPRMLAPQLPRDLEAIILKCMRHDVAQRYPSGRALADDLARFLDGYPVKANPLNAVQRTWRWARREPKFASAAVLALAALLVGLGATTAQWRRANANAQRAEAERRIAADNATTSSERLWDSHREAALRLMRDGKGFDALPALIDNIDEQESANVPAAIERREVGMILHQGVTLIDRTIIPDASPLTVALSPDGSLLAVGLNDISVRWYDTKTLTERGRIDLLSQPTSDGTPRVPRLLRFVDDHRLRVTLDWYDYIASPSERDTILVDLDHARVVAPPRAFADFTDADYSANGRYALLFDREGKGQLWQVEPWRPLSERHVDAGLNATPWIVTNDGQRAIHFRQSLNGIVVVDARDPRLQRNIEALSGKHVTAWQESHDGKRVAIGDDEGNVYLVDVKTATARTLPLPPGSDVTWLAFSEDDAWCAVARHDGDAFAFDVASGNMLHAGLLHHDFGLRRVEISHRNSLLIASGAGEVALWRMPQQGSNGGGEATRITTNPTPSTRAGMFWADAALSTGLLATADMDGELRLWRLPQDTFAGQGAAVKPGTFVAFDGKHVVDAVYNRIRVRTVDGRQATDWFTLPQPPVFDVLVDAGRTLVATSGRALYAFDAAAMRPRYAPVELPGTPNNMAIRADGSLAVLAFGHNRASGFSLRLQTYDPATGQRQAGEAIVPGPIRQMQFSSDGKKLLVVGPLNGATEVFDTATLSRVGVYPPDLGQPVIGASFLPGTDELWLVETGFDESETDSGRLLRWDPRSGRVLETRVLSGAKPVGVGVLGGKPLLFTRENFVLDPGKDERAGPVLHGGEATNTYAQTGDGQVFAHVVGRDVQLYDTATFGPIGPSLPMNWRYEDSVQCLGFDDRGEHLITQTNDQDKTFVWNVPLDSRPLEALRRDAGLLAPAPQTGRVLRMADAAEHTYLRALDPGGWPPATTRPELATARYLDGVPIPRRSAQASPLQLDLTDFYTATLTNSHNTTDSKLLPINILPRGIATLDGTDFDIRGAIDLHPATQAGRAAERASGVRSAVRGIRVPPVPIAALHVLMQAPLPLPQPREREYARIRLHYRDGGEAVLSIRTQRDVPGMSDHDQPTPVGWAMEQLSVTGLLPIITYASPRLVNPYPGRIVGSLDLEAGDEGWSEPVFAAITAEPVIAAAKSGTEGLRDGKKRVPRGP